MGSDSIVIACFHGVGSLQIQNPCVPLPPKSQPKPMGWTFFFFNLKMNQNNVLLHWSLWNSQIINCKSLDEEQEIFVLRNGDEDLSPLVFLDCVRNCVR